MPTNTTRLNLPKPLGTENVNRANYNTLIDAIDAAAQKEIKKQPTTPASPVTDDLWLDTSATPHILKRYSGSAWVKVTPTTASEVGAIASSEKGANNGVATLDGTGKVPTAQLPSMNYIPTSEKGAASGVATLDTGGKVPSAQIPSLSYIPTSEKGANSGIATLDSSGKVPLSQLGNVPPSNLLTMPGAWIG
jgi:hypothetical protein